MKSLSIRYWRFLRRIGSFSRRTRWRITREVERLCKGGSVSVGLENVRRTYVISKTEKHILVGTAHARVNQLDPVLVVVNDYGQSRRREPEKLE